MRGATIEIFFTGNNLIQLLIIIRSKEQLLKVVCVLPFLLPPTPDGIVSRRHSLPMASPHENESVTEILLLMHQHTPTHHTHMA